ncbi:MAG: hypothetical protein WB987_01160 [Candidatus Acidiferrales bacterium]
MRSTARTIRWYLWLGSPPDFPDFAAWLVEQGIDSISLNPDTAIETSLRIAPAEDSFRTDPSSGNHAQQDRRDSKAI